MLLTHDAPTPTAEEQRLAARVKELEAQIQVLETQVDEYQNLYVTSSQLINPIDPQEVMTFVQEILLNLVGAQAFDIAVADVNGRLETMATGELQGPASTDEIFVWRKAQSEVFASGQAVYPKQEPLMAVLPLFAGPKCFGILSIFRLLPQKEKKFSDLDMSVMDFLSQHAGRAIECATVFERHAAAIAQCIKVLTATRAA